MGGDDFAKVLLKTLFNVMKLAAAGITNISPYDGEFEKCCMALNTQIADEGTPVLRVLTLGTDSDIIEYSRRTLGQMLIRARIIHSILFT